ncbi:isopeptide-forming domain-containing fimbrial protein [Psychrobacter sp. I-STPA10]|uniref:isopeptide-forming domain-containing fimbrial protein n=1 Tax=Psychrobacter sp. I-STPA10 TaxID=2585769 RepID=UPI001E5DCD28|nr:isopeptide-forming domain-containing fimbrial protein [Psychrobacter sp. I-STPA10]
MKTNNFKHSVLAVGVVAALGMTGTAFAAGSGGSTGVTSPVSTSTFAITNKATATYNVGTQTQPKVTSNTVTVNVSKQIQFNLAQDNKGTVTPDGKVVFTHTLTNKGNTDDEYTIDVANVTGDKFDYSKFVIEVTTPTGTTTINNGDKITLQPGDANKATIKITATAANNNIPDEAGKLTISATSDLYPAGTDKTLTNTDTATTTTPVFAITKSVSTTSVQKGDTFKYTIAVKNTGNMDATDTTISDTLPTGLEFTSPTNVIVKRGTTDITNTVTISTASNTLKISGVNIAQATGSSTAEDITVEFKVLVPTTATETKFDNKASVIDTTTTPGKTIKDTTDTGDKNVPSKDGNDDDDSNPSTVHVVNSSVTFVNSTEVTLPITGETVFEHILTNNGTATIATNELTLTKTSTLDNANITQEFYIDTNGNGTFDSSTDAAYTPGTPLPVSLAPKASVKIFVKNIATDAVAGTDNTAVKREEYKLAIERTSSTGASVTLPPAITDIVNIAGLGLKKEQAVAACSSTPSSTAYTLNAINDAKPGQCIFYKITAINHLPTTNPTNLQNFTDVAVSDTIANLGTGTGKVTYNADLNGNGMTTSYSSPTVSGNAATLTAGSAASLTFSVTINK